MGIFSNLKINSLRKKIEGKYEDRIHRIALSLENLPQDQKLELATRLAFSLEANAFAKIMNHSLFHPGSGIFRNDIGNLNELNFDKLYEAMVVWYSWARTPFNAEGEKPGLIFALDSLEVGLGINPLITKIYYDGLASDLRLVNFALYRLCMLAVGHIDIYYETMHENSPDCKKFIEIVNSGKEGAEKAVG